MGDSGLHREEPETNLNEMLRVAGEKALAYCPVFSSSAIVQGVLREVVSLRSVSMSSFLIMG